MPHSWQRRPIMKLVITRLLKKSHSLRMRTNSRKRTNAPSSSFFRCIKAMVLGRNLMVFLALLLRRVLSTGRRTTFGRSSTTALSRSRFCPSVWPRVILMTSHTPSLAATTPPKSSAVKRASKLSKTTREAINQTCETGPSTSKTSVTSPNL